MAALKAMTSKVHAVAWPKSVNKVVEAVVVQTADIAVGTLAKTNNLEGAGAVAVEAEVSRKRKATRSPVTDVANAGCVAEAASCAPNAKTKTRKTNTNGKKTINVSWWWWVVPIGGIHELTTTLPRMNPALSTYNRK